MTQVEPSAAVKRAFIYALAWHPTEDGPSYYETRRKVFEAASEAIAEVRAAAFEECAKIADGMRVNDHPIALYRGDIAAAIRKRGAES